MQPAFTLILQVVVVLSVCRVVAGIFRWVHQPRVVGEMFAGIFLGPSLLGWVVPGFSAFVFPQSSLAYLNALSLLGLVLFMFQVGLRLNPGELKRQSHAAILTSHASITLPFLLASLLSLYLYPRLSDDGVSFTGFALFMGASMSITAFPVLARILTERNLLQSRLGTVAITCAAVNDVTGWCILAYLVALVRSAHAATSLWITVAGIIVFILILVFGVKPLLPRLVTEHGKQDAIAQDRLALVLLLVLASALCTEWLGLHLLFGAFLMGAIMPKGREFVHHVLNRLEPLTVSLLLPLFFANTGLRTSIGLIQGQGWFYCGLIIVVATIGKLGGSMLASAFMGMPIREAVGLGALMNTRGLMELVILNIGLDIKVISPALFSMMVIMALVTTLMTTPLLEIMCPGPRVWNGGD
jgi:Kef-type K+ transport system membrane component KefB